MTTIEINLPDYLSLHQDIYFLNLDRCLRQPYTINNISNNETIGGISLSYNYLLQMPNFVSDYINLIELNASHNDLYNTEFLLYRTLNDNETYRPLIHPFLEN